MEEKPFNPYGPHSANKHAATTRGSRVSWTQSLISWC